MESFKNIQQIILNRRSIKPESMNGKVIDDETIHQLLELANWAPTHGFTEPWRFVVFSQDGKNTLANFHAGLYKKETPIGKFQQIKYDSLLTRSEKASHIIAIVMKRGNNIKIPEIEELAATAIAVQNIWLGATALNIACYWGSGGMTYHPEMTKYLGYGSEDKVMGFFYMGYSDLEPPKSKRLTGIMDKTTFVKE